MGDEVKNGTGVFEPPPWELEAFAALALKRAEQQAAFAPVAASVVEPAVGDKSTAATVRKAAKAEARVVEDARVKAMLLELSQEETTNTKGVRLVARISSLVTAAVGIGMLSGGVTTIQRAGGTPAGVMGSGALSVFGLCFLAMAVWVWVGSNRTKGSR